MIPTMVIFISKKKNQTNKQTNKQSNANTAYLGKLFVHTYFEIK